jgi:hypothetical protein
LEFSLGAGTVLETHLILHVVLFSRESDSPLELPQELSHAFLPSKKRLAAFSEGMLELPAAARVAEAG